MKKILFLLLVLSSLVFSATTDQLIQIHPLTTIEKNALTSPVDGMLVYDTTTKKLYVYANNTWRELLFTPNILTKTADYTLQPSDNGEILRFDSTSDVILTVPAGLPVGFNVSVYQVGAGKVNVVGSGTTILNRLSRFKTAGKDAGIGIVSTSTDTFHLTGDLRR